MRGRSGHAGRPRGYSLAEILIAVAIAAVALAGMLHLFRESRRSSDAAREKAGTLHHGRLILERLKRDLRAIPGDPGPGEPARDCGAGRARFSCVPPASAGGEAEPVAWTLDAAAGTVTREAAGAAETFGRAEARVRGFTVREEACALPGGGLFRRFRVSVALSNADDEPRSRLALETVVVPPTLSRTGPRTW